MGKMAIAKKVYQKFVGPKLLSKTAKKDIEKAEFEKRIKKAGPFNSGNKSQAAWGGYGAKPKGIYKAGGMVKKCRMDGIALRGKTRAKERSK